MELPVTQIREQETKPETQTTIRVCPQGLKELVAALCKARPNFDKVKKSSENPFYKDTKGKSRKYADINEIIGATAEALAEQGIYIIQAPIINSNDRTAGMVTLISHTSGEWIELTMTGCPVEQKLKEGGARYDAQSFGIAFTYLARYGEGRGLNLGAEDDDANGLVSTKQEPAKPLVVSKPSSQSELEPPTVDEDGCPLSDPPSGLPTPEQLSAYGRELKDLKVDSRQLKNWVEAKAGKSWKEIPLGAFRPIIDELKEAKASGKIEELIKEKA